MIALPLLDQLVSYALVIYGLVMICVVVIATVFPNRRMWEWILSQWESWPEREIRRRGGG